MMIFLLWKAICLYDERGLMAALLLESSVRLHVAVLGV
jgi:hypothetical protein